MSNLFWRELLLWPISSTRIVAFEEEIKNLSLISNKFQLILHSPFQTWKVGKAICAVSCCLLIHVSGNKHGRDFSVLKGFLYSNSNQNSFPSEIKIWFRAQLKYWKCFCSLHKKCGKKYLTKLWPIDFEANMLQNVYSLNIKFSCRNYVFLFHNRFSLDLSVFGGNFQKLFSNC